VDIRSRCHCGTCTTASVAAPVALLYQLYCADACKYQFYCVDACTHSWHHCFTVRMFVRCNCSIDQIHHGRTVSCGHYTSVTTIRGALYLFDDAHVRSTNARDLLDPNVVAVVLRLLSPQEVAALPAVPVCPAPALVRGIVHLVVDAPARSSGTAPPPARKAAVPRSLLRTAVGKSVVVEVRQGDWQTCAQGSAIVSSSNASFRHGAGLASDIDKCAGVAYKTHCATLGTLANSCVQVTTGFKYDIPCSESCLVPLHALTL
jgi:hypothetical protein